MKLWDKVLVGGGIQVNKNIVYHYCNINTFNSIISNQSLRLSDITKSNDQLEMTWAIDIIKNAFEKKYGEFKNKIEMETEGILKKEIEEISQKEKYMEHINEKISLFFEKNELKNKFFVICFSGENSGDLLSQWRGYGDDGRGISIGFNESMLKRIGDTIKYFEGNGQCILYDKVIYDKDDQKKKIEEVVNRFWEKIDFRGKCESNLIRNELEDVLLKCFPRLYQETIFMKSPFFREEDESRLVICEGNTCNKFENRDIDISQKQYYIRNNQLVGYYDIGFENMNEEKILKLVLGPKCRLDATTLVSYFADNGITLSEKCICNSGGSYC